MAADNQKKEAEAPDSQTQAVESSTEQAPQNVDYSIYDEDALEKMIAQAEAEEKNAGASREEVFDRNSDEFDEQILDEDDAEDHFNIDPDFPDEEEEEQEEQPEQQEEPEPEPETDHEEPDQGDDDDGPTSSRIRVRTKDPVEARALELKKRNPDLSLTECISRAEDEINPPAEDKEKKDVPEDDQEQSGQMTALLDQIKDLEAKQVEASQDYDMGEVTRLANEIRKLEKEAIKMEMEEQLLQRQSKLQEDAQKAAQAKEEEANAEVEFRRVEAESQAKAVDLYPDVTDPNSKLVQRMIEIDNDLKESDNDLHFDPNKHLKIAQMAANDLGIPPRAKSSQQPATPARQPQRKTSPVMPASGSRRTTKQPPSDEALDKVLSEIENLDDLEEFTSKLAGN